MNRTEVARLLRSIREHAEVAEEAVRNPSRTARDDELEVIFRANAISARLSQLQDEMLRRHTTTTDGQKTNLRVLGDGPTAA